MPFATRHQIGEPQVELRRGAEPASGLREIHTGQVPTGREVGFVAGRDPQRRVEDPHDGRDHPAAAVNALEPDPSERRL